MATRPFLARHTVAVDQRGCSPGRHPGGHRLPRALVTLHRRPAARSAARTVDGRHGAAQPGFSSQQRGGSAALSSGAACRTDVVAALRALPAEYSSVIVETFYRGRNVTETADALGVSADMVKARCYDALHALKHALAERGLIA